jgi:hypothetical protein
MLAITFLVASAGFLLQLWPLALAGVVAMACVGRGWYAIPAGFLLDLAYGAPVGALAYLFFPFTIAALAVVVVRFWMGRYFFDKTSQDKLD